LNGIRKLAGLVGGSAALILGVAGTASAATSPPGPQAKPQAPTLACVVTDPACGEIVAAISGDPNQARNPQADAAATYTGPNRTAGASGGAVSANLQNNLQNGRQDWSIVVVATVPYPGQGSIFGLTNLDKIQYGGKPIGLAEYTPFGNDTGFCARATGQTAPYPITLAPCASVQRELFIITRYAPGVNSAPNPYRFLLNVPQAATLQHHRALTMNSNGAGSLKTARLINKSASQPSGQQWTAINS
jgi:hypothetical protein